METARQQALRNSIVQDMYLDTADQNYVVARWCFQMNLALDFLWNAAHCLEKIMKAVLLLNGRSAKKYGHDLEKLLKAVSDLAGDLLPDLLARPTEINMHWQVETIKDFVGRISASGDAHNRYQVYGFTLHGEDIYKLDRVVHAIRRLCCPLDSHARPVATFRELLNRQADYMPRWAGTRLAKLAGAGAPEELRRAALNHNIAFAPPGYDHGKLRCGGSSSNAVLHRRILLVFGA